MPDDASASGSPERPVVYVVDSDAAVCDTLCSAIASTGLPSRSFVSADAFLKQHYPGDRGCLVTDLDLPGLAALRLQRSLHERGSLMPLIMLAGCADIPLIVEAMRRGAFDVMRKPVEDGVLAACVRHALELEARLYADRQRHVDARQRLASLTIRERQVLDLVLAGLANKQIARRLNLSEKTIELHRSRLMRKMGCDSVAVLVHKALLAGAAPAASGCARTGPL